MKNRLYLQETQINVAENFNHATDRIDKVLSVSNFTLVGKKL